MGDPPTYLQNLVTHSIHLKLSPIKITRVLLQILFKIAFIHIFT